MPGRLASWEVQVQAQVERPLGGDVVKGTGRVLDHGKTLKVASKPNLFLRVLIFMLLLEWNPNPIYGIISNFNLGVFQDSAEGSLLFTFPSLLLASECVFY